MKLLQSRPARRGICCGCAGRGAVPAAIPPGTGRNHEMIMQQCLNTFKITHPECRACNGLKATCESYVPNPSEKARREIDPAARKKLPEKLFPAGMQGNPAALQETRFRPLEGGRKHK